MKHKKFIQVGVTAMRDPKTGGFLPSVPIYIEATSEAEESEKELITDVANVFADKMRQYIEGGGLPRNEYEQQAKAEIMGAKA